MEAGSREKGLMRVDLFQDIGGGYFPIIKDSDKYYSVRHDGKVEEITIHESSSTGRAVENIRGRIKKKW